MYPRHEPLLDKVSSVKCGGGSFFGLNKGFDMYAASCSLKKVPRMKDRLCRVYKTSCFTFHYIHIAFCLHFFTLFHIGL
jgi:hypothetical protein